MHIINHIKPIIYAVCIIGLGESSLLPLWEWEFWNWRCLHPSFLLCYTTHLALWMTASGSGNFEAPWELQDIPESSVGTLNFRSIDFWCQAEKQLMAKCLQTESNRKRMGFVGHYCLEQRHCHSIYHRHHIVVGAYLYVFWNLENSSFQSALLIVVGCWVIDGCWCLLIVVDGCHWLLLVADGYWCLLMPDDLLMVPDGSTAAVVL